MERLSSKERFKNTTLDRYWEEDSPNRRRCIDKFGDTGVIVGYHDAITFESGNFKNAKPWFWVIRDRDGAQVGIHESMLELIKD